MSNENEPLLRVEHLCQYFKMGRGNELKAVDDVSFDIKKGEVFGLVGESGCGKTTTGRSIIKLYDITSGSVYFKGQRICAGTRSYQDKIKALKKELKAETDEGKRAELLSQIQEQKKLMAEAKDDHKNCEKKYIKLLEDEYAADLAKVGGDKAALTDEQRAKYQSIEGLPKIPKKNWLIAMLACFGLALALMATAIICGVVHNNKYGNYQQVNAEVVAVDAEAGTTTVTYPITTSTGTTITRENVVMDYYDPSIQVSTEEQTQRISVYVDSTKTLLAPLPSIPSNVGTPIALSFMGVAFAAALVIALYLHERYNPARLITKIQMIFQDPIASLNPRMTVKDIISEGLIISGEKDKKYIEEQVYKVLELVGLVPEHAGRYPHEFSGGQRQRIGVARSIIMKPELIIADEPISALDVSIQAQVINLLNDLREKLGLTILFIAHDLSVVKYFSDRIGVMYFGKMVELADSDELFAHPMHPYTRSLLSAIPLPDPDYEKNRKRFVYNPLAEHDYSVDKPVMREVSPGHFVMCNEAEFNKYTVELKA